MKGVTLWLASGFSATQLDSRRWVCFAFQVHLFWGLSVRGLLSGKLLLLCSAPEARPPLARCVCVEKCSLDLKQACLSVFMVTTGTN